MSAAEQTYPAVSLFSNCGAGDLGFAKAGFDFKVIAELEPMRIGVAKLNLPDATPVVGDLRETYPEVVRAYRAQCGNVRPALLAACPPCQGMSSARSGRGQQDDADAGSKDDRNLLVDVVASVAKELAPRAVVVENVWAFLTRKVRHPESDEAISAAQLLIERLGDDYTAFPIQTDLADYGVPQMRRRSFVVLLHNDEPALQMLTDKGLAPYPRPTHGADRDRPHVTLRAALDDLGAPPLDGTPGKSGEGMHAVPAWDASRYLLVSSIKPNSGCGAWSNTVCAHCGEVEVGAEAATCPQCEGPLARPVVKDDDGSWRLVHGFRTSSYTRMRPEEPAATVTTASGSSGSDKTLHPWENRVLSPLECAHLQTFPRSFRWGTALKDFGATNVRAMIGEAVPPQFTELHGSILRMILAGKRPYRLIPATAPSVVGATKRLSGE